MSGVAAAPFVPPEVEPAPPAGWWRTMRSAGANSLRMWPSEAYEQDVHVASTLGRHRFLLNDEAAIHHVLLANAANYKRTPATIRIIRPVTGEGLILSEGETWRRQRQAIAPALAPRIMPLLAKHVVSATERAVSAFAAGTGTVDVLAEMQLLTLEIASRSMFSVEMDVHGATMRRMLAEYAQRLGRVSLLDFFLPAAIPNVSDLRRRVFRARWKRFMDEVMRERMAAPAHEGARDLFDLLLTARDPESGAGFTQAQLRDQMATLIVAGHETTALSLFWTLYLVANAADVQARLADEARDLDPAAEAARPGLPSLRYTRAVIQESMRLYPPAFTLARMAIREDRVGQVTIPAGSIVLIAPWVLHRHRKFWCDPALFDPSRFEGEAQFAHRYAYLPFGAGPRVCVGAQFAMTEAVLVLAMLMQRFDIALADGRPVRPTAVITTQPDHPAPFHFRLRTQRIG